MINIDSAEDGNRPHHTVTDEQEYNLCMFNEYHKLPVVSFWPLKIIIMEISNTITVDSVCISRLVVLYIVCVIMSEDY